MSYRVWKTGVLLRKIPTEMTLFIAYVFVHVKVLKGVSSWPTFSAVVNVKSKDLQNYCNSRYKFLDRTAILTV